MLEFCPILPEVSRQQAVFLLLDCFEALYGGAVGGGKSAALLMAALQFVHVPGYRALILRRTFAQLSKGDALIPMSHEWLAGHRPRVSWNEQRRTWTFPSGATLEFGHVEHERSMFDYQGAAYQFVGFDELTQFPEEVYDYIAFSRQRRRSALAELGVPVRVRATANPGGIGHEWVKRRFVVSRAPGVAFIPARVWDNPGLDVEAYVRSLSHLPETMRRQLLDGDWDAFESAAYSVDERHVVRGFRAEPHWRRREGMDHGLNAASWLSAVVDDEGNLVVQGEISEGGLPAELAPRVMEMRRVWGEPDLVVGDPYSLAARTGTLTRWGEQQTILGEYREQGLMVEPGERGRSHDPRAAHSRIRDLLRCDESRRFPDWHPRRGEKGSPRLFFSEEGCPDLISQLRSAPLEGMDRKDGGERVMVEWERRYGHAHAALRYLVMSFPTPTEPERPFREEALAAGGREITRVWRPREEPVIAGWGAEHGVRFTV